MTAPPTKERKRAKRAPSLGRALKQVRAAGEKARTVRYYSDHVEIDLGEPESAAESNPWLGDLKVTKQ